MTSTQIKELKATIGALSKAELSDEALDKLRQNLAENGNSDDAFDKGIEIGEVYGANSIVIKILELIADFS